MATSSITKEFVIRDEATYERFIKLQEEPVNEKPRPKSNRLEEGYREIKTILVPLKRLMREASEQQAENLLSEALDMFRCFKDADIESFLREKAIEFEKRGFCTVYLI